MRRFIHAALLVGAVCAVAGPARAVTYIFTGDCDPTCGGVSGSISFDDAALVPGNPYPAPTSFLFSFGGIEISDATALGFGLFAFPEPPLPGLPSPAVVPADVLEFAADLRVGETPQPSGDAGDALSILLDGRWFADDDSICSNTLCTFITSRGTPLQGTGAWSTVPAPPAAALLATALAGLAARRRRIVP
jgi:hypothetical protein